MKKLLIAVLTVALCMGLVACGNTETTTTATEAPASTETPVSTEVVSADVTPDVEAGTVGAMHWELFNLVVAENPDMTAEEIANAVLFAEYEGQPLNPFMGGVVPVDSSFEFYNGFGEEFVMGEYKSGAMFGPMMGSIAYIGYIFELEEGADVEAFVKNLTDNCNPRWQICVTADQTVAGSVGNKVFFLMCPATYEMPEEAFGGMALGDEEFAIPEDLGE